MFDKLKEELAMETQRSGSYEPGTMQATVTDGGRVHGDAPAYGTQPLTTYSSAIQTGENVMPVRNRVQWGPIVSGLLTAIVTMLVMTVLGIALGASVLDRTAPGEENSTWAAVWGGISAIVSFFVGGWVAAKTAAVGGPFAGLINGFMVGAAGLALILWLTGTGLGNLFGTIGANIGDIANVAQDQAQAGQAQADPAAANAEQNARSSFDELRNSAWGTLVGLLLALGAAALGGYLGHNKREDLLRGTG